MKALGLFFWTAFFNLLFSLASTLHAQSVALPECSCADSVSRAPERVPALGASAAQREALMLGWSVKRNLIGKRVINDKMEKIGQIDDIIILPATDNGNSSMAFAIIGVGGFLGIGSNDVAIPMTQIKLRDGNLVLPGSTKEALKQLPQFEALRK